MTHVYHIAPTKIPKSTKKISSVFTSLSFVIAHLRFEFFTTVLEIEATHSCSSKTALVAISCNALLDIQLRGTFPGSCFADGRGEQRGHGKPKRRRPPSIGGHGHSYFSLRPTKYHQQATRLPSDETNVIRHIWKNGPAHYKSSSLIKKPFTTVWSGPFFANLPSSNSASQNKKNV